MAAEMERRCRVERNRHETDMHSIWLLLWHCKLLIIGDGKEWDTPHPDAGIDEM